jgi:N-acetylglutamate synthase-like GNAT family acetyltransferase
MSEIRLRPAVRSDAAIIRRMISSERLNPFSLDWRRFILAVDENGHVAACVQVKPHGGGIREMASLVVQTEYRGQGLARRMIESVLARETGTLYLTCRASLIPFYNLFGFQSLPAADLPPYYQRLTRLVGFIKRIVHITENLAVMRRENENKSQV